MDDNEGSRYKEYPLFLSRKQCEFLVEARKEKLISMPIYGFSVNVLCQDQKGVFLPLEMSIFSYNLREGKTCDPYHVFIDPGDVPVGCFNIARDHMQKHRIGYPFGQEHRPSYVRSDYKKIYKEILKFTQDGERTLLVMGDDLLNQAKGTIEWLYDKATEDGSTLPKPSSWSIVVVSEFVAALHNYVRINILKLSGPRFALHYRLKMLLGKATSEYQSQYMCDYHKETDKETCYCTKICAIRTITMVDEILEETYQLYDSSQKKLLQIKDS